jgi:hypothetical protein
MPFQTPTLGGNPIFGTAVRFDVHPNAAAIQRDAYPGLNGQVSQFLGTRGGRIRVTGEMIDVDIPSVNNDLQVIVSYNDGVARTLVDCEGNAYFNVIMAVPPHPKAAVPAAGGGWLKEYTVEFDVLSG